LPTAVDIARLPAMVRGYEQTKLASVTTYRKEMARGLGDARP